MKTSIKKIVEHLDSDGNKYLQEITIINDDKGSYMLGNGIGFREGLGVINEETQLFNSKEWCKEFLLRPSSMKEEYFNEYFFRPLI